MGIVLSVSAFGTNVQVCACMCEHEIVQVCACYVVIMCMCAFDCRNINNYTSHILPVIILRRLTCCLWDLFVRESHDMPPLLQPE